jgi:hypothetical protein
VFTVQSTLRDAIGNAIDRHETRARSVEWANAAAHSWATGWLAQCDDPNAYVEHIWSESKSKTT